MSLRQVKIQLGNKVLKFAVMYVYSYFEKLKMTKFLLMLLFYTEWWSRETIIVHESSVVLIILFHWFGVETTYRTFFPLDWIVFISLQLWKTPDGLHTCSTKLIFSFEKSRQWHGLLLYLTSLWNHKNWDLILLGVNERKVKVFSRNGRCLCRNQETNWEKH